MADEKKIMLVVQDSLNIYSNVDIDVWRKLNPSLQHQNS